MSPRSVKLLHVEDDVALRKLIAHQLRRVGEFEFDFAYAEGEEEALGIIRNGGVEIVILDYDLPQGNGISCLKQLRDIEPVLPVIAVSGVATAQIAAELLNAGADDYIGKDELNTDVLVRGVRQVLIRDAALAPRIRAADKAAIENLRASFRAICNQFIDRLGPEFANKLDAFESDAHNAGLTVGQLQQIFETTVDDIDTAAGDDPPQSRRLLSPILLEILLRVVGELPTR